MVRPLTVTTPGVAESINIMQRLPTDAIEPEPFVQGSRLELDKTLAAVARAYGTSDKDVVDSWTKWDRENCPRNDNANDFVERHPDKYHIPFRERLFGVQLFFYCFVYNFNITIFYFRIKTLQRPETTTASCCVFNPEHRKVGCSSTQLLLLPQYVIRVPHVLQFF